MSEVTRCRADARCRDGENRFDPDTGEKTGRVGALIHGGPFCEACIQGALYVVQGLGADYRDLTRALQPAMAPKLRDPDLPEQPRVKKPPPLPLNVLAFSVMELLVYEVTVWAESTADAAGADWDSDLIERLPWPDQVAAAAQVLEDHLGVFLSLVDVEHRARSLTLDAAHGHDEDRTVRSRDDVYCTRDGWEGALKLQELRRAAEKLAGRHPGDKVPTPCPSCHTRDVVREHHNQRVVCRACERAQSDDEYEDFLDAVKRTHRIPVDGDDEVEVVERAPVLFKVEDLRDRWSVA